MIELIIEILTYLSNLFKGSKSKKANSKTNN